MPSKKASPGLKVGLLSIGHLVNDVHTAFLDTFLPELVKTLALSYSEAGILTSLSGLVHMVLQPVMGYLSDRNSRPWAIILGPIAAALGAASIPLSPNYGVALMMVFLWAVGAAAFHPQGQGSIGYVAPSSKLSLSIALFGLCGMVGSTLSSFYAVGLYHFLRPHLVPLVALIPVSILAWSYIHYMPRIRDIENPPKKGGMFSTLTSVFSMIWPIWAVTITRDCSKRGLRFLIPLLIVARGGSLIDVSSVLFAMSLLSAIIPIIVVKMAMKYGNPRITKASMTAGAITLIAGWIMKDSTMASFVLGGALLTACTPATAAMAQEQAPDDRSAASSLMMGFSFGFGGLAMAPLGLFTDFTSIETALGLVCFLPLLSLPVMIYMWPKKGIK